MAWAQSVPAELSLRQALDLAVQRNPTLAASAEGIAAAQGGVVTAKQRPNPAVTVETSGPSFLKPSPPIDQHEFSARIDQEIEIGARRTLRTQVAELGVAVANADVANVRRQLELQVRRAYFAVVLTVANRQAAQEALEEIDRVIALNRARLDQGEISGAELRRIQVERLKFQDDVFSSELALRNAQSALLAILNMPDLRQVFRTTDDLSTMDPAEATALAAAAPLATNIAQEALAQRPDVEGARVRVQQADTATRLQGALRTPFPTVGGGYRHDAGQASAIIGVTIPLPLFNRNRGEVLKAQAEGRQRQFEATAIEREASLEIRQALNAVEINRERVSYIGGQYLTAARESRDVTLASYRLGAANLIDFLDAQRAFRDTLRTYNQALFEQRLGAASLIAALGIGLER
ncbi:MAG: TolC family protein [Gemmatimonadaceae bacterium]|nr:TolC family protein [Gemmatimonadaceae bacterium]